MKDFPWEWIFVQSQGFSCNHLKEDELSEDTNSLHAFLAAAPADYVSLHIYCLWRSCEEFMISLPAYLHSHKTQEQSNKRVRWKTAIRNWTNGNKWADWTADNERGRKERGYKNKRMEGGRWEKKEEEEDLILDLNSFHREPADDHRPVWSFAQRVLKPDLEPIWALWTSEVLSASSQQ